MEKKNNGYYKGLDLIRVISCILILLYHMNILKGGYLAVCTFFVLSGYLSTISLLKKEKLSLKEYYLNRLKKIYLPLIIVVFITISITSFIPSINWFNLKPETTSVLLNYNNYWQIMANLDYFARHIDSPFMHLWYMSILIEFDLVFPFIFLLLKKLKEKTNKIVPCILTLVLALASYALFYKTVLDGNIMQAYYDTFNRLFSLLFGILLALLKTYYHPLISKKMQDGKTPRFIFYSYLLLLVIITIFIDSNSKYMALAMLATSLITMRLIDYGTISKQKELSIIDKVINFISKVSYYIYLVQYPVIFLFQEININYYLKLLIVISIVFLLAYIINFALTANIEKDKFKILRLIVKIIIILISIFGIYKYIIAKDHTEEMHALDEKMNNNKMLAEEKQKEFLLKKQTEEADWEKTLKDLENNEKNLGEIVRNLKVVGVGDSIMLGALDSLYKEFPNGYFDAAKSRTDWEANGVLVNLKNRGILGDIVIFNLGTNGECPQSCKNEIFNTLGNRQIFWFNATKPDYPIFNTNLKNLANTRKNIQIVDWIGASKGHYEYFVADGIHLTKAGGEAYAKTLYNTIYEYYLQKINEEKNAKLKEREAKELTKITFIGNDILLNAYEYLIPVYPDSEYIIDATFNYDLLFDTLKKRITEKQIAHNIVIMLDNSLNLTNSEYQEIIELCKDYHIYIIAINKTNNLNYENVDTINFYTEINNNSNYLMVDKRHLTKEGNLALIDILKENLNS